MVFAVVCACVYACMRIFNVRASNGCWYIRPVASVPMSSVRSVFLDNKVSPVMWLALSGPYLDWLWEDGAGEAISQ